MRPTSIRLGRHQAARWAREAARRGLTLEALVVAALRAWLTGPKPAGRPRYAIPAEDRGRLARLGLWGMPDDLAQQLREESWRVDPRHGMGASRVVRAAVEAFLKSPARPVMQPELRKREPVMGGRRRVCVFVERQQLERWRAAARGVEGGISGLVEDALARWDGAGDGVLPAGPRVRLQLVLSSPVLEAARGSWGVSDAIRASVEAAIPSDGGAGGGG